MMKKAFSALAIALAIMAGVVFAGYQWTKYQYGGETYYALVGESWAGEGRNRVVVQRRGGKWVEPGVKSAAGRVAHVRDLVVYDGEGRRKVCRLPLHAKVGKALRQGGYVSVVKCRRGLIWKCVDRSAVPYKALERIDA